MSLTHNDLDIFSFENVFGTPSAQKIICLLVTWPNLSLTELILKSGLSKSQIYSTLKSLQKMEVIVSQSRGNYSLNDVKFSILLKEAYLEKILEIINKEIYLIKQQIKRKEIKKAERKFEILVDQYDPILKKNFSLIISSLAYRFIDTYK